jgi:hypothetical protein
MKKKSLHSIGDMMDSVLSRHGIKKQVVSAQIVTRANELLRELLDGAALLDVKVLSLKENMLTLACRHSAALYDGEGVAETIARKLEEEYPDHSFTCIARLRPEAFEER